MTDAGLSVSVNPGGVSAGGGGAQPRPGFLRTWWVAMRPFALPASVTPVLFGTVAAVAVGGARLALGNALLAMLAMALMHTGANLLNDAVDYRQGLDVRVNPVSGAVVRGWLTPAQAVAGAAVFFAAGSLIGLWLVWQVGTQLLWIGLAGLLVGVFYSLGPLWLKARALGDLAVCVNFGLLGALGAWTVQAGAVNWVVVLWALPIGLLVAAILHANNWRDIAFDNLAGVSTMAGLLGDRGSLAYYGTLVLLPYLLVAGYLVAGLAGWLPRLPWLVLLVVISLPESLRLLRRARRRHRDEPTLFLALDGASARLNMIFGLLYTVGLGLGAWLGW